MPYAPGIQYRGDQFLFAGLSNLGSNVSDAIRGYRAGRKEREQLQVTAEMLAKYHSRDPDALGQFGDQFSKVPSMSTSQLKGFVGGLAAYTAGKEMERRGRQADSEIGHAGAQDRYMSAQVNQIQSQAARRQAEDAARQGFNDRLAGYLSGPYQQQSPIRPEEPRVTPEVIARFAAESGYDPLAASQTAENFLRLQRPQSGLTVDDVRSLTGGGSQGYELGQFTVDQRGQVLPTFTKRPPAPVVTPIVDESGRQTGKGQLSDGRVIDIPGPKVATSTERQFAANAAEMAAQLDEFEKTVKEFGNFEAMDSAASAKLNSLPWKTAILYAKIVDPDSVAREGEVEAAKKYLIPTGFMTRNSVTLSAIKDARSELARRLQSYRSSAGQLPSGLPDSIVRELDGAPKQGDGEQMKLKTQIRQYSVGDKVRKKDGRWFEYLGGDASDAGSWREVR